MNRIAWSPGWLGLVLVVSLALPVQARQHQERHGMGTQMSGEQDREATPEASGPMPGRHMQGMMQHMHGMMQHMQGMMQHMHGRRGGGMMPHQGGMMGRRGMMADEDDEDDDADRPWRGKMGMMGAHGMRGHGHKLLRMIDHLAERLELSDEQEARIRTLVRSHMKRAVQARADIAVHRIDLFALLDAESVDLTKVKELLHTMAAQRADLLLSRLTLMQEIHNQLTPEQQEEFRGLRKHFMHGRGHMMGHGRKHGRGGMHGQHGRHGARPGDEHGHGPRGASQAQ